MSVEILIPQPQPWWETFYSPDRMRAAPRHAHGAILVDGVEVASTYQCPHCGGHDYWMRGDAEDWCVRCARRVCKKQRCIEHCAPWEQQMERIEAAGREQLL